MKRRKFIRNTSLAGLSLGLVGACASMDKKDCEVLILGAGLSGLNAAILLEKAGIDYKIIDGSPRIGGRVYSEKIAGTTIDWGGVEVGNGYKRLVAMAEELNVPTKEANRSGADWLFHYKGENVVSSKWAHAKVNDLPEPLRKLPPYFLESSPLRGKIPFKELDAWFDSDYANLDISHAQYLRNEAGYNDVALDMIDHAANHNGVDKISLLHNMRSSVSRQFGGSTGTVHFKNGSESIATAMAKTLKNPVAVNKKVTEINDSGDVVKVTCSDGTVLRASKVICTIPFSVLRDIKMSISASEKQAQAIKELKYTQITQVAFVANEKYWESDNLPLSMWTDTPIERVFAAGDGEELPKVFKAWINGEGAKNVDRLSDKETFALVENTLAKIRPSTKGKIECVDMHSWGNYEFNKGAYAEFHVGQVKAFVPEMAKPAGNVYFAGEHTSFIEKGLEGAMASGERSVQEILESRKKA